MKNKKKIQGKEIISKDEFLVLNRKASSEMIQDKQLIQDAKNILERADKYRWIHQSSWLGEPLLNLPQDMFAIQEIIWKTKPDYIIEIGVCWGGSILFEAMLLDFIGGKKIIGIDIFIPQNLRDRLSSNIKIKDKIELIEGESTKNRTIDKVKSIVGNSSNTLVILDSFHTHEHVLNELRLYSPLVGKGNYLICGDTIIDHLAEQTHRPRPWGPGNNPGTAVKEFLSENSRFSVDSVLEEKLLFSCHPGGYLRANY
jgi:cephalosporin hydroxylase